MKHVKFFYFFLVPLILCSAEIDSTQKVKIYYFKIFDEIHKASWWITKNALESAKKENADVVLLHLNTYGGELVYADSIRSALLSFSKPVWVFIDKNAASAGALISMACNKIYMKKGATIGAATVVDQSAQPLPDKYQSYMRAMMRSTAEARGRNPEIAEAMVDPDIKIPGIVDSGKVLTFTVQEAIKHGFCDGEVDGIYDILALNHVKNYEIIKQRITLTDKVIYFFMHPVVSGILILLIALGVYYELQTPGIGLAFYVALAAALLFFVPYFLEGFLEYWELILFVIGLILILLEIFVIPGFGVAGISGILLMVLGLTFAMVDNKGFSMPLNNYLPLIRSFFIVITSLIVAFILSLFITPNLMKVKVQNETISLTKELSSEEGFTAADKELYFLIGKKGIAYTVLRPAGKVKIDDEIYDAVAFLDFIEKGESIEVVDVQTMQLVVKKVL
jgi:membrane-bound serine protease (ClpP class)